MMEFSLFDSSFHLYHDIWWDGVHFMGSFCVFCNFSHQLSFGGGRGLKPTVLTETCKGWHLLHPWVIILCLFIFFVVSLSLNHQHRKGQCRMIVSKFIVPPPNNTIEIHLAESSCILCAVQPCMPWSHFVSCLPDKAALHGSMTVRALSGFLLHLK